MKDYIQAYKYEGHGGSLGSFGMQVLLSVEHPLSEKVEQLINHHVDILRTEIQAAIFNELPQTIERVKKNREELIGVFPQPIFVEEIPNGYGPNDPFYRSFPWYRVTTSIGPITLGWRKRVIEIDYSGTTVKVNADQLFTDDVTRFHRTIHAWGIEKAREYINTLLNYKPEAEKSNLERFGHLADQGRS
jgi:hypothetical protein